MDTNYQYHKLTVLTPCSKESLLPLRDYLVSLAEDMADHIPNPVNDDADFWTYDRQKIASFAKVDARVAALKSWRLAVARENSWSPWIVFTDKQLTAIADVNPSTLDEFSTIQGISPRKVSNYGADVIKVLSGKQPSALRFDASEAL